MGTDYWLARVTGPVEGRFADAEPQLAPLGSRREVMQRLRKIGARLPPKSVRAVYARIFARVGGGPRERMWLPAGTRHTELTLAGDPVMEISGTHIAPWDLAPVARVFAHLDGVVVMDPQQGIWYDARDLAPKPPAPVEPRYAVVPSDASWCVERSDPISSEAVVLASADDVIVADHGFVTSLVAKSGATNWTLASDRGYVRAARIGGLVVIGAAQPTVFAFDAAGRERWRAEVPEGVARPPIEVDRTTLAVATTTGHIVGLAIADGKQKWIAQVEGDVFSLVASKHGVIVGTNLGGVYVLGRRGNVRARCELETIDVNPQSIGYQAVDELSVDGDRVLVHTHDTTRWLALPSLRQRGLIAGQSVSITLVHGKLAEIKYLNRRSCLALGKTELSGERIVPPIAFGRGWATLVDDKLVVSGKQRGTFAAGHAWGAHLASHGRRLYVATGTKLWCV